MRVRLCSLLATIKTKSEERKKVLKSVGPAIEA